MSEEKLLLRIPEVSERTGLGRSTIYTLIAGGEFPAVKIGRSTRIPADAVRAWVDQKLAEQPARWGTKE